MDKKETLKEKIENLFDNDPTNSNNIFDRVQDQMTSPAVDEKIRGTVERLKEIQNKEEK